LIVYSGVVCLCKKNQTINFTTNTKQVIHLILIMLVGTNLCVCVGGNRTTRKKPTCSTW